ncbi:MAG: hypothetical protein MdMp014T_1470 [Treponematales bacterium]
MLPGGAWYERALSGGGKARFPVPGVFYGGLVDVYKGFVEFYKTFVDVYKSSVEFYRSSVEFYKGSVEFYKTSVDVYKGFVEFYKTFVDVYKGSVELSNNAGESRGNAGAAFGGDFVLFFYLMRRIIMKYGDWLPRREADLVLLQARWKEVLSNPAKQQEYGWPAADCAAGGC